MNNVAIGLTQIENKSEKFVAKMFVHVRSFLNERERTANERVRERLYI